MVASDHIELNLTIGSNFITSGVLNPTKALAEAWPINGATVQCFCDQSFDGRVKISDSGALVGWSPLITHGLLRHDVRESSTLTLRVADEAVSLVAISEA
jgi:hypothetical protein